MDNEREVGIELKDGSAYIFRPCYDDEEPPKVKLKTRRFRLLGRLARMPWQLLMGIKSFRREKDVRR